MHLIPQLIVAVCNVVLKGLADSNWIHLLTNSTTGARFIAWIEHHRSRPLLRPRLLLLLGFRFVRAHQEAKGIIV